jgi:hypothetical protein
VRLMRRSSLAVASAMVRLPRSIARWKMLSEWPCEVDAPPSSGPDGPSILIGGVVERPISLCHRLLMLCRLALALACGLALATPSLADDGPPAVPVPILVTPPLQQAPQADWKLVAGYGTWKPEQRNRIFYARTPGQVSAWKYHVYDTYETRAALHQNFSRYGLLAIFLSSWEPGSTIAGVYLARDGALNVQIRAAPPTQPPDCSPTVPSGGPDAPCSVSVPGPDPQYRLIAIRKGSLPRPVKRLYITEVS